MTPVLYFLLFLSAFAQDNCRKRWTRRAGCNRRPNCEGGGYREYDSGCFTDGCVWPFCWARCEKYSSYWSCPDPAACNNDIENYCQYYCNTGSGSECRTCVTLGIYNAHRTSGKENYECGSCNSGYYLSDQDCHAYTCSTSSSGTNCLTCVEPQSSRSMHNQCNSCNPGHYLNNGRCYEWTCSTGSGTTCRTCATQSARFKNNQCAGCDAGYYLTPSYTCAAFTCSTGSGTTCKTCQTQANMAFDNHCSDCNFGYYLSNGRCFAYDCDTGSGSACRTCKTQTERTTLDHCSTCNDGYRLDDDSEYCEAWDCAEGDDHNCMTCHPQNIRAQEDHCSACNPGYYGPNVLTGWGCEPWICTTTSCRTCAAQHLRTQENHCGDCHSGHFISNGLCIEYACQTGEDAACAICEPVPARTTVNHCQSCNTGFYIEDCPTCSPDCLPYECAEGQPGNGCLTCEIQSARSIEDHCYTCNPGYYREGTGCTAFDCDEGENDFCETCQPQEQRTATNHCLHCNAGYYMDGTECSPFECIEGGGFTCKECKPQTTRAVENHCDSCNDGYFLVDTYCDNYKCDLGQIPYCRECREQWERTEHNQCWSCEEGFSPQPPNFTSCRADPTVAPTIAPSVDEPTLFPSQNPTTDAPSAFPTSEDPSRSPTASPSSAPSPENPTASPSNSPSVAPSRFPTTDEPTANPSTIPSLSPTTDQPTNLPSTAPTESPTTDCTIYSKPDDCRQSACAWNYHTNECLQSCYVIRDLSFIGTRINGYQSSEDHEECEILCMEEPACLRYTYSHNLCSLFQDYSTEAFEDGSTSGICVGTHTPTDYPTASPTSAPSAKPSFSCPTQAPTSLPTVDQPTKSPSGFPTSDSPSKFPTTEEPSTSPSTKPSFSPTKCPTTDEPSSCPTSDQPSTSPTMPPTTGAPTSCPSSEEPSRTPSQCPTTDLPTQYPTESPTTDCALFFDEISCRQSQCAWNRLDNSCVHTCTIVADYAVIGVKISNPTNLDIQDLEDCEVLCVDTTECVRFSFGNSVCSLYSSYTDFVVDHGTMSGICLGTHAPTDCPTTSPTTAPTANPTTSLPSQNPSVSPSAYPTSDSPSKCPTTDQPTISPTKCPTTDQPTTNPSYSPTILPTTEEPTKLPTTDEPTMLPSCYPTTYEPSNQPSSCPTSDQPTQFPTESPTTECVAFTTESSCRQSQCGWNRHDSTCVHGCVRIQDFVVIGEKIDFKDTVDDAEDCEQACIDNVSCVRFSFGNAVCSLYSSYTDFIADHGTVSGFCLGTHTPTEFPTTSPTTAPTQNPTVMPTVGPSPNPTTDSPSLSPTSQEPTVSPSPFPSTVPTVQPSEVPSVSQPSHGPSLSPILIHTITFEDADYDAVIGDKKEEFLTKCTAFFQDEKIYVECIGVESGSILLHIRGAQPHVDSARTHVEQNGLFIESSTEGESSFSLPPTDSAYAANTEERGDDPDFTFQGYSFTYQEVMVGLGGVAVLLLSCIVCCYYRQRKQRTKKRKYKEKLAEARLMVEMQTQVASVAPEGIAEVHRNSMEGGMALPHVTRPMATSDADLAVWNPTSDAGESHHYRASPQYGGMGAPDPDEFEILGAALPPMEVLDIVNPEPKTVTESDLYERGDYNDRAESHADFYQAADGDETISRAIKLNHNLDVDLASRTEKKRKTSTKEGGGETRTDLDQYLKRDPADGGGDKEGDNETINLLPSGGE